MHAVRDGQAGERGGHGEHIASTTSIHEVGEAAHEAGLDAMTRLRWRLRSTTKQIDGERGLIG